MGYDFIVPGVSVPATSSDIQVFRSCTSVFLLNKQSLTLEFYEICHRPASSETSPKRKGLLRFNSEMLSVAAIASFACQPQSKYQRGGRLHLPGDGNSMKRWSRCRSSGGESVAELAAQPFPDSQDKSSALGQRWLFSSSHVCYWQLLNKNWCTFVSAVYCWISYGQVVVRQVLVSSPR